MTRNSSENAAGTPQTQVAVVGNDDPELIQDWAPGPGEYPREPLYWPC